jgi:hypothetical protein
MVKETMIPTQNIFSLTTLLHHTELLQHSYKPLANCNMPQLDADYYMMKSKKGKNFALEEEK